MKHGHGFHKKRRLAGKSQSAWKLYRSQFWLANYTEQPLSLLPASLP